MNLADALAHHARSRPDHPAIVDGERVLLHRDLDPLVRRTASHLAHAGLAPGDVVGLALRDTADHLVALYAVARLGAIILPLDWRWTADETARVARHFGAQRVLVEAGAAPLPGVATLPADDAWRAGVATAPASPGPTSPRAGNLPLLLSLSSGTTGTPKGPLITHGQLLARFWTHWINLGLNSHDCYLSATPLYFGGGRSFCMSILFAGGTVVLFPPPYTPEALGAEVVRRGATSLFLVPTLLRRLLELPETPAPRLGSLRTLLSSGSALHPEERRAVRRRICPSFFDYYASTEGGGISLLLPEEQETHGESVGRPVFGVEVEIVDDDHRPLPPGAVGLLRYRGPGVATGFHADAAASAEAFRDGWFYPGDLAATDEAGYVYLRGRRKDMIIRGGVNIHPTEIEAVLLAHPQVVEAAVVGWPSREFGEEVAAFVVPRGGVTEAELVAQCRAALAPYKTPRRVFLVADLPKNSVGKIVKTTLAAGLPPL